MFRRVNHWPIKVKAFAASAVLAVCLVGLGSSAFFTLNHWARGLERLAQTTLPEQSKVYALHDRMYVAVNLSPVQIKSGLVQSITNALAASGVNPGRLELEITESVLLDEHATSMATLQQLRAIGMRIAIDDFGTGYSSLSYLRKFAVDKIKIDRLFVAELTTRPDCAAIIRALLGMAHELGIATTAEGVEEEAQLLRLSNDGCIEAQGYLFSRPRPASELRSLVSRLHERAA